MSEFNWNTDPDVIIRQQLAVAVWLNERGELVILQERDWNDDCDTIITVAPANIQALIDKALFCLDQLSDQVGGTALTSSRDPTAAERQRRYRERKKVGVVALPTAAE